MNQRPNQNRNSKSSNNRYKGNKNKRRNNNSRRRNNNKKFKINLDPLFKKYSVLLEEMIAARKKYFEMFHRCDEIKKTKLETTYVNKIKEFNEFKDKLNEDEKEKLASMFPSWSIDTTYSTNHEISPDAPSVEITNIDDPHFLESQKNLSFSDDTEESSGSLEDYKTYKGIN